MKLKNILTIAITVALLATAAIAQVDQMGARPLGAGGAYTALAKDANAPVWNPAAMESFRNLAFTASYSRLYLGVDDDGLNEGFAGFVNHLGLYGNGGSYGMSFSQYFSDVYSQMHVTLGYAKRLYGQADGNHLALGANFKLIRSSFNEANFSDDFDITDEVFSSGNASMAYSADVGLIFRPTNWLSIGATVKDVLQPDISISGSGGDMDLQPMTVRGGLALHYKGFTPTVDIEYTMREINGESDMKIHAGLEKWLGKSFGLRGGLNRDEAALGLSYVKIGERFGWGIDYAALYPVLNDLGGEFFTTHKIAVNLTLDPPPPPIRDLELVGGKVEVTPTRSVIGDVLEIRAVVENRGEIEERNVRVSVYYQDDAGMWQLAVPVERYDFDVAERRQLSWKWSPPAKGRYTMFVAVDDKGDRLPDINGRIPEEDEDNNVGMGEFQVFLTPEGMIFPRDSKLTVSKLTLYQEEEPIIPIVFFEEGKSDIDSRYDDMLKTVAERLTDNPDVVINIRGYFDELKEPGDNAEQLATARGRAVGNKLIALGAPRDRVAIIETGYNMSRSRVGNPSEQVIAKDQKLMMAENRRAELSAWFPSGRDFIAEVPMTSTTLSAEAKSVLSGYIAAMQSLLNSNPELVILIESYHNVDDVKQGDVAFMKAAAIGKYLKAQLGEDYEERIRIHANFQPDTDPDVVLVFPNSEGVIWRPKIGDRVFTDYLVEGREENLVQVNATVDAGVDSFGIVIVNDKGDVVRMLAAGKGDIPSGLAWDWRNNSGELLDFDHKYFARLDVRDKMGESFLTYSDTMEIQVSRQSKRIESLVIVLFRFNEEVPASKFLESRVEYVASRFIARAEAGKANQQITAVVSAHTDSIGPEYANIQLSNARANRELNNLRRYMMYLLDMTDQAQLDKWLTDHNVSLKAKGHGEGKPYEILRWTGSTVERILLGENATPEGRTVNRRVLLELETVRTN
jgi:outer membrane protein OmpA-like peptidoglycan-associated protein